MKRDIFEKWLKNNTDLKIGTINSYGSAINTINKFGKLNNLFSEDLYQIEDLNILNDKIILLEGSELYIEKNQESNRRWSSALEHYKQYISSEEDAESKDKDMSRTWFVGAAINRQDQTQRFIEESIWQNGYSDKYIDLVNSIQIGDLIAIKSSYTRKYDLPFNNEGDSISVMGIKAIGKVTDNIKDGRNLKVDWKEINPIREWYFFTNRSTVWQLNKEDGWREEALINFAFKDKEQDYDKFINYYYEEDYQLEENEQYGWISFYEVFANKLLEYKNKREVLLEIINQIFNDIGMKNPLIKKSENGKDEILDDVCPFTVMGLFNKGITDKNRIKIIEKFSEYLEIDEIIPDSFDGIPVLNNMKSWFFGDKKHRKDEDIDNLWKLFELALKLADDYTETNKEPFIDIYDKVIQQHGVQWNITFALYWIRPWDFLTLDNNTRTGLIEKLKIKIPLNSPKKTCTGLDYLSLIELLKMKFEEDDYPIHSFPELSYKAWSGEIKIEGKVTEETELPREREYEIYTKENFLKEVFMDEEKYMTIKSLLERKKNLILQGAPGVGKTFIAKRLAYSLMGIKDEARVKVLQFHQSYSYEDFIMGYRPNGSGFELKEGPFYEFSKLAAENIDDEYFFIIDEINRGNMSKIFGELMMLIESDKRGEEISLIYSDEPFYIPKNLYIIGMMNTADRSLAIIDYALRRRFSFVDLEPAFEKEIFKNHLLSQGVELDLIDKIVKKMKNLNQEIEKDLSLGKGFRVGHSYFCDYVSSENWYEEIIRYEIAPLIEEYWFDDEEKGQTLIEELLR